MTTQSIYLIQCESTGLTKIGISRDPAKRLNQLQTGSPGKLKLVGMMPGDSAKEANLHRELADRRVKGEWFDLSDGEVESIIRESEEYYNPVLDSFKRCLPYPMLSYLTSQAVGFVAIVAGMYIKKPYVYQVMRQSEGPGRGQAFWSYYLYERRQWFDTPEEACTSFVCEWQRWIQDGRERN